MKTNNKKTYQNCVVVNGAVQGNIVSIGNNVTTNVTTVKNSGFASNRAKRLSPYDVFHGRAYIFVSYSHADKDKVFPIISELKKQGYRVWYDEHTEPGTNWDTSIATYLNSSAVFICFITKSYWKSGPCKEEMAHAFNLKQYKDSGLIPVYLEPPTAPDNAPELQMRLSRRQSIFAHSYSEDPYKICRLIAYSKALDCCKNRNPYKN